MDYERFLRRVEGVDLPRLMPQVCGDFRVGNYSSHFIPNSGYEDLNVVLETDRGRFFAKIFADTRSDMECLRYVRLVRTILEAGVRHPDLYRSAQGFVDEIEQNGKKRVALMQYIDGKTLFELGERPNLEEGVDLIAQVAKINRVKLRPPFIYDSWAIPNIVTEFKEDVLEPQDRDLVKPVVEEFKKLDLNKLPHTFVHGDIISTNVMKDVNGKLYIIDFAVANWYPRIQELAVLACDLFFDPKNPSQTDRNFAWLVKEYQRHIKLTPEELAALPTFVRAAHAMHIIGASYERSKGNEEGENNNWLTLGRLGLRYALGKVQL